MPVKTILMTATQITEQTHILTFCLEDLLALWYKTGRISCFPRKSVIKQADDGGRKN